MEILKGPLVKNVMTVTTLLTMDVQTVLKTTGLFALVLNLILVPLFAETERRLQMKFVTMETFKVLMAASHV